MLASGLVPMQTGDTCSPVRPSGRRSAGLAVIAGLLAGAVEELEGELVQALERHPPPGEGVDVRGEPAQLPPGLPRPPARQRQLRPPPPPPRPAHPPAAPPPPPP